METNNELKQAVIAALPLLSEKAISIARTWLLEKKKGFTKFYPATQALDIVFNLPIGSDERIALQDAISASIPEEMSLICHDELTFFFNKIDKPINDDNPLELAGVINDILENIGQNTNHIPSDLAEEIINTFDDLEGLSFIKEIFFLLCGDRTNIDLFDSFVERVGNVHTASQLLSVFMYCITSEEPTIIKELLASTTFTLEFDNMKELADDLGLKDLAFYSDDETTSFEKFNFDDAPVDSDDITSAITDELESITDDQINIMLSKLDLDVMMEIDDEEFSDCVKVTNNNIVLIEGLENTQKAEFIYFCLAHDELFDLKDEIDNLHKSAQEQGASNEANEAVSKHSVFELGEEYTYNDDGKLLVKFDTISLWNAVVLKECGLECFDDNYLQNFNDLEEFLRDIIFSRDSDFKGCDLDVPYYGFYGFDREYFSTSLSELLYEKELFKPLAIAA